ncbi:MAG TPA: helix-turn-helix domain-containing protein [Nitrolancea sp.]|nr:helix-turn-helix domain-containing protein [Nitrolancea sp.]
MSDFPANVFVVRDLETLKAVSDPLRMRIFGLLQGEARTVKELARELGGSQTRLYYHVNQLEAIGLIQVAETRVVGGIIEKHYRAGAARISVDRRLLTPGAAPVDAALETMLSAILDGVRDAIRESVRAELIDPTREEPSNRGLLLGRKWLNLTHEDATELFDRLTGLLAEFATREGNSTDDTDAVPYEVLVGLYPVTNPPNHRPVVIEDE